MNAITLTLTGWVATEPKMHTPASGAQMCTFRLASTERHFDRDKNEFVDGKTEWFSVRQFRAAAVNVAASIHKGQPVIVTGRLHTNEWAADNGTRTDLVIDAAAVGHDLTKGTAEFTRDTGDYTIAAVNAEGGTTIIAEVTHSEA